jgi:hypothetical protein
LVSPNAREKFPGIFLQNQFSPQDLNLRKFKSVFPEPRRAGPFRSLRFPFDFASHVSNRRMSRFALSFDLRDVL